WFRPPARGRGPPGPWQAECRSFRFHEPFHEGGSVMRSLNRLAAGVILVGTLTVPLLAGDDAKKTWTFDDDETGAIAKGFTNEVGEWKVAASDQGKALAQFAKNPNSVFNVTLISGTNAKDVDLSVRMKAIAGEHDQGGGLVWRARDAKNYYLARYNPLEDNYRL